MMPTTFKTWAIRTAVFTTLAAALPLASARSDQLTNGKNGTQPNTLDSESSTGSGGVAPSREIYRQGSDLRPGGAQPDGQPRTATPPKTQD